MALTNLKVRPTLIACGAAMTLALVGCKDNVFPGHGVTNNYRSYIPDSATKVAHGTGRLAYTAMGQGTAILVDASRREQTSDKTSAPWVVGSYLLLKGQTVTVDGAEGKVMISGTGNVTDTTVSAKKLTPESAVELYFDPKVKN